MSRPTSIGQAHRIILQQKCEIEMLQDALFKIREMSVDAEEVFIFDLIWDVAHAATSYDQT